MSFQLAGQALGSFFGPIGSFVGGVIGGLVDRATADGPSAGDLSAPGLQLGRQLPRVYGRVRLPVNPIWASEYRATEHSAGKGAPAGPSSFTYSLDMLGAVCDGTNVIAVTRIWVNKKLVYTALAASSDDSVVNSQDTDYWSSFTLQTGGPSQVPWSVYEDAVGAVNAPAYRNLCTIGFADLQCGSSKTPPAIEVEVITEGATSTVQVPPTLVGSTQGQGEDVLLPDSIPADAVIYVHFVLAEGVSIATPTGYSIFSDHLGSSGSLRHVVYRKEADGTEGGTTVTFTTLDTDALWCAFAFEHLSGSATINNSLEASGLNPGSVTVASGTHHLAIAVGFIFTTGVADATIDAAPTGYTILGNHVGVVSGPKTIHFMVTYRTLSSVTENASAFDDGTGSYGGGEQGVHASLEIAGGITAWTPSSLTLDEIISPELQLNPEVPASDFDVTDLASIPVIGYIAAGSPARTCQELCDIHYVDVVPGNPIVFQRRGTSAIATVPFIDTGVGSDGASDPFTGLKRGNPDERPAVAAISFPLIDKDHEPGYERGDRLATDADDVRVIKTSVVMEAPTAKGRAITATLLERVRTHTANISLSDKYASREPADVDNIQDDDGNTYRVRINRFAYSDGVKACEYELDDTTALVDTGLTDNTYTPSVEIVAPGVADVLPLDIPLQRVQDDDPGYLAAVKCSDDSRVYYLESPNDTTYTEVAQFPFDAVFGTVISITGTPSLVATDTGCEIIVDVGDGTLSSITDAALLLDNSANRFVMGVHGRWVVGQFRDATLDSDGYYVLSGFVWGLNGTSQYVDNLVAGDSFCILNESGGVKHIDRTNAQLGVAHYIKAVPERRTQASITGEAFTNSGVALKPLAGINPHADRDATSGDITITWDRQTRYPTRFGGDLGDSVPLGEESERYRVRLYTSSAFTTVLREFSVVTTAEVTYTSAQRTTDSHSPITAALYVDVRQISAVLGEGYALQATL